MLLIGLVIGAATGAFQFWLLMKYTGAVTGGNFRKRTALFAVSQFLLPFPVLLGCALLLPIGVFWTGAGMAASLVICAFVRFALAGASSGK